MPRTSPASISMSPVATGSRTTASAFEVLWSRPAEWERRLTMVREASQFLYVTLFYLEYDDYGREMLAALLAAQRRGVRVQLVIDYFGQRLGGVLMTREQRRGLDASLADLQAAGARVVLYRPPRWTQRRLAGGHHVKIQVSEAGEALLCSGNITKSSFDGWNECAVSLRGAVARALLESCRDIGAEVRPEDVDALGTSGAIELDYWFCNPNQVQGPLGLLGWQGPNAVTDRMVEMVDAARTSLVITSFYFKPAPVLFDAVLRAARRGVRVEVFHSHRDALPATDLAWIAAATSYGRLLDAGVHLHENRRGEHSKIVLVDEAWVAYGSYNFEDAAHDRLAEAMVASRDRVAVDPAIGIVAALRGDPGTERVTAGTVAAWPDRVRTRVRRYGRFKRWM